MTKRVLWLSRHEPLEAQKDALKALAGEDVEVIFDPRTFGGVEDILERIREHKPDDVVIVAPLFLIAKLAERGVQPLWAEMVAVEQTDVTPDQYRMVQVAGRLYEFRRFRRLKEVRVIYDDDPEFGACFVETTGDGN